MNQFQFLSSYVYMQRLCESAYALAQLLLADNGVLLCKQWQGSLTSGKSRVLIKYCSSFCWYNNIVCIV